MLDSSMMAAANADAPSWLNLVAIAFVILGAWGLVGSGLSKKHMTRLLVSALLLAGGLLWFVPFGR